MRALRALAPISLALATGAATLFSQQAAPSEQRYLSVIALKVPAAKAGAIRDHYKSGAGAKVAQARLKANPKLLRWTVLEAIYPGDPAPDANFMIAFTTSGTPPSPDQSDDLYRSAVGMTYAQYMEKVRSMSEPMGQTLSHIHDVTDGYTITEGDIVRVSRLKLKADMQQPVTGLMRDQRLPLMNAQVKQGGRLKGWSFSHLSAPTGDSLPYNAMEAQIYKDLDSAVGGPGQGGGGSAAGFLKVLPNRNYVDYINTARNGYTVVRADLWRVVAAYRQ